MIHLAEHTVAAAFDQAEARDRHHARDWLVLVDGTHHQIDLVQAEADRRGIAVHILIGIVHVSKYVWGAAHCFQHPGTPECEAWVAGNLTTTLHGQAPRAVAETTAQADQGGLRGTSREGVDACIRYLTGHPDRLPPHHRRQARHYRVTMGPGRLRSHPQTPRTVRTSATSRSTGDTTSPASTNASTHPRPTRPPHHSLISDRPPARATPQGDSTASGHIG